MPPVQRIDLQPWMTAPQTRAVLAALGAEGAPVRFVGGCVRDTVLGRPVRDIDIATPDPPETVIRLLEAAEMRAIPTGIDHGTVTAVAGESHFEITTLRRDVETYGRRAKVAFTDDWAADAARRDFTINAIYCDPDGALYDPTGGLADLAVGVVRFVGVPEERIAEDYLRILRFFRFYALFGGGPPDEAAIRACAALAGNLPSLSGERVWSELRRILMAPAPAGDLSLMAANGALGPILPEAEDFERLSRLVALEVDEGIARDPVCRLAAVLAVDARRAAVVAERLRFSNVEKEQLVLLAGAKPAIAATMDDPAARRDLYRYGVDRFRDLVLLAWAGGSDDDAADWRRLLAIAADWRSPGLPVGGADVLALGVAEGPDVGRLLAAVEAWWLEGDFKAGRPEVVARLKQEVDKVASSKP